MMVRNDVGAIAATSRLRPVMFPVVISSGDAYSQFDDVAKRAVAVVPPAGIVGSGLLRDSLMQSKVEGPTAMMYMAPSRTLRAAWWWCTPTRQISRRGCRR